jgi:hypothetical protein
VFIIAARGIIYKQRTNEKSPPIPVRCRHIIHIRAAHFSSSAIRDEELFSLHEFHEKHKWRRMGINILLLP